MSKIKECDWCGSTLAELEEDGSLLTETTYLTNGDLICADCYEEQIDALKEEFREVEIMEYWDPQEI